MESADPKACIKTIDALRKSLSEYSFFKTIVEQLKHVDFSCPSNLNVDDADSKGNCSWDWLYSSQSSFPIPVCFYSRTAFYIANIDVN